MQVSTETAIQFSNKFCQISLVNSKMHPSFKVPASAKLEGLG